MSDLAGASERLNRDCFCLTLDRGRLCAAFEREVADPHFCERLFSSHPHLFSNVSVFLSDACFAQLQRVVRAIEAVAALPDYRDAVLAWAPSIAQTDFGPAGAFMGCDFHLSHDGPKLIEVNTNAGGASLNAVLARAQSACCGTAAASRPAVPGERLDSTVVGMFCEEWRRQRGAGTPRRIAIVDDEPAAQYLYPEFVLMQALFRRHGIEAVIADAVHLVYTSDTLVHDGEQIDLVYNRLVDFPLSSPRHEALRSAYMSGKVVVTPNPHVHARLADKRNLTLLSDPARLTQWSVDPADVELLAATVPKTTLVGPHNADDLWKARRQLFFKPATGYGSKAAYRGAKLTKTVWAEIVQGGYVAQTYAAPSERMIRIDGKIEAMKMDVRLYTYRGKVLLTAARLYKGQTTNFRTEGGGFAPVLRAIDNEVCAV